MPRIGVLSAAALAVAAVLAVSVTAATRFDLAAEPVAARVDPPAPTAALRLVFADEFDQRELNDRTWHTCFWWAPTTCTIETHHELGLYTADNVSVADGVLRLQARREPATGWNGRRFPYTSGAVSTGGSTYSDPPREPGFVFRYGYVEARMRVPRGRGLVSAFWFPTASHHWPPEIDVMEILGSDTENTTMHYHYLRADGTRTKVGYDWRGPDFAADWHVYGVDWRPGSLVWYVDGIERARYESPTVTDEPAYLLFNLAVGGTWPGSPNEKTAFPAELLVDWVRVHQRPAEP